MLTKYAFVRAELFKDSEVSPLLSLILFPSTEDM